LKTRNLTFFDQLSTSWSILYTTNNVIIVFQLYLAVERYLFTFGVKQLRFDTLNKFLVFVTLLAWLIFLSLFWSLFFLVNFPQFAGTYGYCSSSRVYTFPYSLYVLLGCQIFSCILAVIVHNKNKQLLNKFNVDSQQHDLTARLELLVFLFNILKPQLEFLVVGTVE